MKSPEEILKEYNLGICKNISSLGIGFIHKTWLIETDSGKFILQKVNPIYTPLVMEDIDAVLEHLRNKGHKVSEIIKTKNSSLFVEDEGGFWRIFSFIEGNVYEVTNLQTAHEAGKLLGSYHRSLEDLKYEFKHVRPIKNNIPLLFKAYKDASINNTNEEIAKMIPVIDKMIELDLPDNLRKTTNHGDPKISNFIFSNTESAKAIAMVDFDDCGKNYNVLHELGSAFRSWSWQPDNTRSPFDLSLFSTSLQGYLEGSKNFLTDQEMDLIPQVLKLNLLQLGSRFVRDYFEEKYFEWDSSKYPSLKDQNLTRAKEHLDFYEDICKKEQEIKETVNKLKD